MPDKLPWQDIFQLQFVFQPFFQRNFNNQVGSLVKNSKWGSWNVSVFSFFFFWSFTKLSTLPKTSFPRYDNDKQMILIAVKMETWIWSLFITQLSTQKSNKNQKWNIYYSICDWTPLNITSQSSYKYLMYFWQSLRETASYHLVRNTCWKRKEFMDIQYQCHSRSETSKNILFQLR